MLQCTSQCEQLWTVVGGPYWYRITRQSHIPHTWYSICIRQYRAGLFFYIFMHSCSTKSIFQQVSTCGRCSLYQIIQKKKTFQHFNETNMQYSWSQFSPKIGAYVGPSQASLSEVQCTLWRIWTSLNPFSTDRHNERDECVEEYRLQPGAKVCIPQPHSTVRSTVAHLLQQLHVQEAAWLIVSAHRAKVRQNNWPRPWSTKKRKKKYIICHHTPTENLSENPALLLSGKQKNSFVILKLTRGNQLGANTYKFNWDGISQNTRSLSTVKSAESDQSAELSVDLTLVAGGIIKTVPLLHFPVAALPLDTIVSQLNWKHASAAVNKTAMQAQRLSINYPISGKLYRRLLFVLCDY